jgi:hypothetical protein
MQSPEQQYLEQVLGVRHYVRPAGAVSLPVCVLSEQALSADQRELLEKMLASVHINDFNFHAEKTGVPDARGYVLLGSEEMPLPEGALCVRIGELEKMLQNPNAPDVRNLKKQIWEDLKVFKKNLEI